MDNAWPGLHGAGLPAGRPLANAHALAKRRPNVLPITLVESAMAIQQSPSIQPRPQQVLAQWLQQSTGTEKNPSISRTEAQALISKAEKLGQGDVAALRTALLKEIQGNAFTLRADARELFLQFFKLPPDSIPVSSTARSQVNSAQQTRIANETDRRAAVTTREVKDFVKNADALPADLRGMVADGLMRAVQNGNYKLDHDARNQLTRFIAQSGAGKTGDAAKIMEGMKPGAEVLAKAGTEALANTGRMLMATVVNTVEGNRGFAALDRALSLGAKPMSYAQYVMANGGSFEEILFAFLLEMADKADKKMMDKIQDMQRKEQLQKGDGKTATATADARIKALLGDTAPAGDATPAADGGAAGGGGAVKKVSTQLEAMVQSVHHMVQGGSEGGAAITQAEASKLVDRLKGLPPNVQSLMAGSIATAMGRSGMQMQPEAKAALTDWGRGVKGKEFDAAIKAARADGRGEHGGLAAGLAQSGKLEDKLAAFLVDTLTSDSLTLKEKFKPFKEFRAQLDAEMGPVGQQAAQATPANAEGAAPASRKGRAGKAEAAAEAGAAANIVAPQQAEAAPEAISTQDTGTSDTWDQNELQRLMQERNRIFDMLSNMIKAMNDMIMTSVRNMR